MTSQIILDKVTAPQKVLMSKDMVMDYLKEHLDLNGKDVLVTMGAGDIDRLVPEINQMLNGTATC